MDKPIIKIHDLSTNEIIEREMNDDEFKNYQKDLKQFEKDRNDKKDYEEALIAKKQAIADRLGLTIDELKLLLG
jgi:hypothetical protein